MMSNTGTGLFISFSRGVRLYHYCVVVVQYRYIFSCKIVEIRRLFDDKLLNNIFERNQKKN